MRRFFRSTISALLLAALGLARPGAATAVPTGFVIEDAFPGATFHVPIQVVFLPDGRSLVIGLRGMVWTMNADGTQHPVPFLDIRDEVERQGDLGLLSCAIDPDFETNRWVYFAYTVDPDGDGEDDEEDAFSRVTRYRASLAEPNVADLSTRQVLIGPDWPSGIASLSTSHSIGALRFAADRTLLVSAGDGAHFEFTDRGGLDPDAFGPGQTDPAEDMGAFRARSLKSLNGKILRIDKETGAGLPSNPYWNGDPTSDFSRIWVYGLRNPYRFSIRPGTGSPFPNIGDPGVLYIGDVGWITWEELDIARTGGINFGWPCREGANILNSYHAVVSTEAGNTNVLCSSPLNPENPEENRDPDLWWHHFDSNQSNPVGLVGASIIGGPFYTGTTYPAEYQGRYFLGDYVHGWIGMVDVDAADSVTAFSEFHSGIAGLVDITAHPVTGDLYLTRIFTEQVLHVRYDDPTTGVSVGTADGEGVEVRPNPFSRSTSIHFDVAATAEVAIGIWDVRGRKVRGFAARRFPAGRHSQEWDGRDDEGRGLGAGVYFVRVEAGDRSVTRKVVRVD